MASGTTQVTTRNLTFVAGEDLTGKLYYAVTLNSDGQVVTPTSANAVIIGFVQNKALEGEAVLVTIGETSKAVAGGNISIGDLLIADNTGKVVSCPTSAGTYNIIGIALEDSDLEDGDLEDGDLEDGDLEDGDAGSVIEVLIRPMIKYVAE